MQVLPDGTFTDISKTSVPLVVLLVVLLAVLLVGFSPLPRSVIRIPGLDWQVHRPPRRHTPWSLCSPCRVHQVVQWDLQKLQHSCISEAVLFSGPCLPSRMLNLVAGVSQPLTCGPDKLSGSLGTRTTWAHQLGQCAAARAGKHMYMYASPEPMLSSFHSLVGRSRTDEDLGSYLCVG